MKNYLLLTILLYTYYYNNKQYFYGSLQMKITIDLTDKQAKLIHTCIRRQIFETYIQPMYEANDTKEDTENRIYDTIEAMYKIKDAIAKKWGEK